MTEECQCCGQRIRKMNGHTMDKSKLQLLMTIARLNLSYPWIKVQRDGSLIKPEEEAFTVQCDDVHALRLTWFDLLERRERRSGCYRITETGREFLAGRRSVPAKIYCKDGLVIERTLTTVFVDTVRGVILDKTYWDNYANEQKPASSNGLLF